MKYLFIYDIADKKRLYKIAHIIREKGIRTQYSFFECNLTAKEMLNLYNNLKEIINDAEDKLFIVPVNSNDEKKVIRIGKIPNSISKVF